MQSKESFNLEPKILVIVGDDADSRIIENTGDYDLYQIPYPPGLWYGYRTYDDKTAYEEGIDELIRSARDANAHIAIWGVTAEYLPAPWIAAASKLARETSVSSVLMFTKQAKGKNGLLIIQIYIVTGEGIRLLENYPVTSAHWRKLIENAKELLSEVGIPS